MKQNNVVNNRDEVNRKKFFEHAQGLYEAERQIRSLVSSGMAVEEVIKAVDQIRKKINVDDSGWEGIVTLQTHEIRECCDAVDDYVAQLFDGN